MNINNLKTLLAACGISVSAALAANAQVTLTGSDGFNASSFNSAGLWSDGLAPHSDTNYATSVYRLRTPPDGNSYTFEGASLTLNTPGADLDSLAYKGAGTAGVITVPNLILAGGLIVHLNGSGDWFQLGGAISVISPSTIEGRQGPTFINANLSGSSTVTNLNGTYGVTYTGDNSAFTGRMVAGSGALVVFTNTASVPGNPASATPDQITLLGGSTLRDDAGITLNNANGGITLTGNASITPNTNFTTTVAVPIAGGFTLTKGGAGALTLSGANTISNVTLSGASVGSRLNINSAGALGVGTFSIVNGDNGIIDNTSGSPVTLTANNPQAWNNNFTFAGSSSLSFGSGAVTLGGNRSITVNANNLSAGPVSGGFSLVKAGAGTLTIGGATYTGNTTVNAGTLALSGATSFASPTIFIASNATLSAASGLTLASGQTLSGSGAVSGNVTDASGSIIVPGTSAGTLTVNGNLTLGGGGALNYELTTDTTAGAGVNDLIVVSGQLNLAAPTTLNLFGVPASSGTYTLIQYGSFAGDVANLSVPLGYTVTNNAGAQSVQLIVTHVPAAITWLGDGVSNLWDVGTTPNWTNGSLTHFFNGDSAAFNDLGDNTVPVQLPGPVSPAAVTVSGSKSYTFTGGSILTGSLTNNGSGTLTLSNVNNSYTGPTVINAGTVRAASGSAIPDSSAVVLANAPGATLDIATSETIGSLAGGGASGGNVNFNSQLTVGANNTSTTFGGAASGSSRFVVNGTGSLTVTGSVIAGNEIWVGGVSSANTPTLNIGAGGTVIATNWFVLGRDGSTGTINVNGGTMIRAGGGNLTLGSLGTNPQGILNLNSGTISNLSGETYLGEGSSAGNVGIYNQAGGTAYLGNFYVGRGTGSGMGRGQATVSGGTMTVGNLDIGYGNNNTRIGTNTFTIGSGATVDATGFVRLAFAGSANLLGMLTNNGGILNVGATALYMGFWPDGCVATVRHNSGALNLRNNASIVFGQNGIAGSGNAFDQNGGTVTFYSDAGITLGGTGSLNLGNAGGGTNTYNLNGGTLTVPQVRKAGGTSTATFNFNGGTLKPTANSTTFMEGLTRANVRDNGAIIDTAGFNVTINQALEHSDIPGDPYPGGGLTKLGAGTLTLATGFSSYSGPTFVGGGTLNLSPSFIGNLNDLTVSNAALTATLNSGTLYAQSINFKGASTLNVNYGVVSGTPSPALYSYSGVTNAGTVTINVSASGLGTGPVKLIQYSSGSLPTNNFVLGTLPAGLQAVLTNNAAELSLDLMVTSAGQQLTWMGNNGDFFTPLPNWNIGGSANWYNQLTFAYGAQYLEYGSIGDNVLFNDDGYFVTNINLTANVKPATMVVNSTYLPYSVTGTGSIGGALTLVKTNGGSLFLGTSNSYTGGTIIGGDGFGNGSLTITNDNALGAPSGNVTLNGATLQLNGVTSARSVNLPGTASVGVITNATSTLSGTIAGSGGLTKVDDGTLTLSGTNTYTGSTIVKLGTLAVSGILGTTNTDIALGPDFADAGTMQVSGSANVAADRLIIGGNSANAGAPGVGVLTQSGGVINSRQWFTVGSGAAVGGSSGSGTFNMSGGILNVHSQQMEVGNFTATTGTVNMSSSASLNIWNNQFLTLGANNDAAGGTFNQNGGTVTLYGDAGVTPGGNGVLYIGRAGTLSGTFTYNLNGGTLRVPQVQGNAANTATRVFNFNGGTLQATKANATFLFGLTSANVLAGGAVIDTLSNNITISQALLNGGGGLTKLGTGTLTLTGSNTFSGATLVNDGALLVSTAHQVAGPVTVANAATFGVNAGSAASVGNLTLGNSTLQFNLLTGTNPVAAVLNVGALNVNGAATVRLGGSINAGTFPVLTYTSLGGSGAFNTAVEGPQGMVATLSTNTGTKTIFVTVTSKPGIVWDGTNPNPGLTNLWDLNTTTNWLATGNPTTYQETVPPGDAVTFNDLGTGVVILSNTASPASVTISNVTKSYTLQGTGHISGPTGITKDGANSAAISMPGNNYTGPTAISAGTLNVSGGSAIGDSSAVNLANVAGAALNVTGGETIGSLAGGGTNGGNVTFAGTLNLGGNNNATAFAGNLFSADGELNKFGTGAMSLSGTTDVGQFNVDNSTVTVTGTLISQGSAGSRIRVGRTAGNGVLNVATGATVIGNNSIVAGSDTSTGTINVNGGTLIHQTGLNFYLGSGGSSTGLLALTSGVISNLFGGVIIGESGSSVGTYTQSGGVGLLGGDIFLGQSVASNQFNISGGSASAVNLYIGRDNGSGTATLSGGTLSLSGLLRVADGTGSTSTGTGAITVTNSAILNVQNDLVVGYRGANNLGKMVIDGGTVNVATTTTRWLIINQLDTASGHLEVNAGQLNLNANTSIRFSTGNSSAQGANNLLTLNGGAITFYSDNASTAGGTGQLDLQRSGGVGSSATVNLNGGTLTVPQIMSTVASGSRVFNFNGGTLKAAASSTTFMQGLTAANIVGGNGGATIDTAGYDITIGQNLLGDFSFQDVLIKNGAGRLNLNGNNTFTGGTQVMGGSLGGTGVLNSLVYIGPSAALAPGALIGTLTITNGGLNLQGNVLVEVNTSLAPGQTNDLCVVDPGYVVNYSGTGKSVIVTNLGPALTVGDTFKLFSQPVLSGQNLTITGVPGVTWTNELSTLGQIRVLSVAPTIPTTPTNITFSASGGVLTLAWPSNYVGWVLQSQTNSRSVGLNTNWFDVPGSSSVTATNMTMNPANPTVFFRLRYP